jgi:hypothetical protein
MTRKLERRFADWEEYRQEFESNLRNFGLFIPGEVNAQLREKIAVEIWLPRAPEPLTAQAEVVAVFPAGAAVQFEKGPELARQLAEKEKSLKAAAPEEAGPEAQTGESAAQEAVTGDEAESPEEGKAAAAAEDAESEGGESAEEIEQKVSRSGADLSNMYQTMRKLSRIEKLKLAKRGNRRYISFLIQEGDRQLVRFIIQNPHLSAVEVLQLLKNPQLTTENIQELARNPAFGQNEEIRYQLVIHPKTPLPTALSLLTSLNPRQLGLIAKSQHMRHQLKASALKLVLQRQSSAF